MGNLLCDSRQDLIMDAFCGVAEAQKAAALTEYQAACEKIRPSYIYKPNLFLDGNEFCALVGENIQEGVCGFGTSPEKAMAAFDLAWVQDYPVRLREK